MDWSTFSKLKDNYSTFFDHMYTCELCLETTSDKIGVCTSCQYDLPYSDLSCPQCSEPCTSEGRCGDCQKKPPSFDYSHCSLLYYHPVPHWLHRCKDKPDLRLAKRFAQLMSDATPMFTVPPDFLTYIPTTRRRLFTRGFNLSEELCQQLGAQLNIPILHGVLHKSRHTEQRQATAQERRHRDTGLRSTNKDLSGQHILIIDDVMTTGETLQQAAALLKSQGASTVGTWCLARTPKPI